MLRHFYWLFVLLVLASCTTPPPPLEPLGQRLKPTNPISIKALGTQKAVRVGLMRRNQAHEESPVRLYMPELVHDYAMLTKASPETCADVTLNTDSTYDVGSDQLNLQCEVDGVQGRPNVLEERVRQTKYPYSVSAGLFEKRELMFAVTSRVLKLCCPGEATNYVKMTMSNKLLSEDMDRPWVVHFQWYLSP